MFSNSLRSCALEKSIFSIGMVKLVAILMISMSKQIFPHSVSSVSFQFAFLVRSPSPLPWLLYGRHFRHCSHKSHIVSRIKNCILKYISQGYKLAVIKYNPIKT